MNSGRGTWPTRKNRLPKRWASAHHIADVAARHLLSEPDAQGFRVGLVDDQLRRWLWIRPLRSSQCTSAAVDRVRLQTPCWETENMFTSRLLIERNLRGGRETSIRRIQKRDRIRPRALVALTDEEVRTIHGSLQNSSTGVASGSKMGAGIRSRHRTGKCHAEQ